MPGDIPLATPFEPAAFEMVATDPSLEDHVTTAVRSRVVVSENLPVALKAWARATAGTAGSLGVNVSDTSTAFVTVSVVEPEIEPNCAEIWVVPGDIPLATPFEPAAFEMVATDPWLEDHVTTAVRSRVVVSENVPVALKAWARATAGTPRLLGVTSSDTSTASVTPSVVEPEIEPNCAEIWVVPGDIPLATPFEPAAFEMVATDPSLEDHVTTAVRSRVVVSENLPVALKAWARATAGTAGSLGVNVSDTSTAFVTVSVVEPEIEPNCAEIWVVPGDIPLATPFEPAAFEMVATDPWLEDHVTTAVRSRVVVSENVPVALKAWARATAGTPRLLGVTSSDTSTASVTPSVVEPEIEPGSDASEVPAIASIPVKSQARKNERGLRAVVSFDCFIFECAFAEQRDESGLSCELISGSGLVFVFISFFCVELISPWVCFRGAFLVGGSVKQHGKL